MAYLKRKASAFLNQGASAPKLALAFTIGIMIGIIPLIGVSTALCALLAALFGLNHIAIQAANYMVYPLQIILIIPFMQLGQWILGFHVMPASPTKIISHFREDWLGAFGDFWIACLAALLAWAIFSVPAGYALHTLLLRYFGRLARARGKR